MEKKNTVLLTVIAVATLLVAVVGATFAYFTATASTTGDAKGETDVSTAKVANVTLNVSSIGGSDNIVYPGTMNYVGSTAKASVDNTDPEAQAAEYTVSYTVTGKITLTPGFAFPVNYSLYKVSSNAGVTNPVTCDAVSKTPEGSTVQYSQTCTASAELGEAVDSGPIAAGTTEKTISYSASIDTDAAETDYYYLVVEYPNAAAPQDADQGKSIKAEIVSITNAGSVAK